jgi:hypothetical protein
VIKEEMPLLPPLALWYTMAIQVLEFLIGGYKIRRKKSLRINIPKGNYLILSFRLMVSCQKSAKI